MFEEAIETIESTNHGIRENLQKLRKADASERPGLVAEIKQQLDSNLTDLDIQYSEAQMLDNADLRHDATKQLDTLKVELQGLKDDYDIVILGGNNTITTLNKARDMTEEEGQQMVIDHGRNLSKATKQKAENILNLVNDANLLADDINDEIREQNQRLLEMEDLIKDANSTLKRTNQLVNFFARAFYKDMCLKCMIVLIAIAILAIICVTAYKKAKKTTAPKDEAEAAQQPALRMALRVLQTAGHEGARLLTKKANSLLS